MIKVPVFDNWFYQVEGFTLKAERFYDDLEVFALTDPDVLKQWLKAAFEAGAEMQRNAICERISNDWK